MVCCGEIYLGDRFIGINKIKVFHKIVMGTDDTDGLQEAIETIPGSKFTTSGVVRTVYIPVDFSSKEYVSKILKRGENPLRFYGFMVSIDYEKGSDIVVEQPENRICNERRMKYYIGNFSSSNYEALMSFGEKGRVTIENNGTMITISSTNNEDVSVVIDKV